MPVAEVPDTATPPARAEPESQHLSAPLYVAWQITNECNLASMHCIDGSGPGKRFKDELSSREMIKQIWRGIATDIVEVGRPRAHALDFTDGLETPPHPNVMFQGTWSGAGGRRLDQVARSSVDALPTVPGHQRSAWLAL